MMKSPALVPRQQAGITLKATLRALAGPALLSLVFVGVGVVHVTSRVLVVSAGYRLSRLDTRHRALAVENDRLKLELATLKAPARLERLARERLGMGPPAPDAVLDLRRASPSAPQSPIAAVTRWHPSLR
ncbi:MAG: cell division protein FtsL [Myxococcaceae bacterium]